MTATTVGDIFEVAEPVAATSGGRLVPGERAGVRPRARVRVPATLRDGKILSAVTETAGTVRSDLAGSWLLRHHPPSLAEAWASRRPAKTAVPGSCETPGSVLLYALETGWRHAMLLPYGLAFGLLWLLHRGVTGFPTVIVAVALAAMWLK